jgi:acyl-CoA synthetase (AMP-forming)/AMP-acid ligase II
MRSDERFGQAVAALVVREPSQSLGVDDTARAVRESLAGYKVPRRVRFVNRVLRSANDKVDYEASRALVL